MNFDSDMQYETTYLGDWKSDSTLSLPLGVIKRLIIEW